MKIQTQIALLISVFLAAIVCVITVVSVNNIRSQGEIRLKDLKQVEIERVKQQLKDLVNVVYESADANYDNLKDDAFLSRYYDKQLRNMVAAAESIVRRHQALTAQGKMTLAEAQAAAALEIKQLKFSNISEYVWINDTKLPTPSMVMHPTLPELDGTVLNDRKYRDATESGQNLFTVMVERSAKNGEAFVRYLWPKPVENGLTEQQAKISFVKRIDDWHWVLGAGFYIDDAEREIRAQIVQTTRAMRYDDGVGYFWINTRDWPFPTMVMHPTLSDLEGTTLEGERFNNAMGKRQNLFQAMVEQTQDDGIGYVDYLWPKPIATGLTEEREKISFVREHKGLDWIFGTGVYIDTIDELIAEERNNIEQQVATLIVTSITAALITLVLAVVAAIFFARSLAKPIKNLTETADLISKGKNLDEPVLESNRKDEIGDLARSIERLKASVKIMMRRMTK